MSRYFAPGLTETHVYHVWNFDIWLEYFKKDTAAYHSAGKHDRGSYIHYTFYSLYYLPPLLFTLFTIYPR